MLHCPNCGKEFSLKQNFCKSCGNDLSDFSHAAEEQSQKYIADEHGEFVTPEKIEKLEDVLDSSEEVHYMTEGSTVDVEGSSAGNSLFGDNRSRKMGTRGYVRSAITNKRVVVKIPQFLGNDERYIPYRNITSVDLDTGLIYKRISLQTPGQTYHIEVIDPGKDEVRKAVKFIRDRLNDVQSNNLVVDSNSEPDPTQQLKNVKELYEEGFLTESEFEDKKQSLLDKI
jgi:hypothetical protein